MKNHIVKARGRTGTSSLDLTLPAEINKEYGLNKGDVFKISVENDGKNFKIIYKLVYKETSIE